VLDIKLNADGDLDVSTFGDISMTESVRQAVLIRLRWIYDEWRLGPEYGFPWFEEVFVKNPNTIKIKQLVREEILKVSEVRAAEVTKIDYDPAKRTAKFYYTVKVGEETYREEVTLYG
jgi:hypothetical protein